MYEKVRVNKTMSYKVWTIKSSRRCYEEKQDLVQCSLSTVFNPIQYRFFINNTSSHIQSFNSSIIGIMSAHTKCIFPDIWVIQRPIHWFTPKTTNQQSINNKQEQNGNNKIHHIGKDIASRSDGMDIQSIRQIRWDENGANLEGIKISFIHWTRWVLNTAGALRQNHQ